MVSNKRKAVVRVQVYRGVSPVEFEARSCDIPQLRASSRTWDHLQKALRAGLVAIAGPANSRLMTISCVVMTDPLPPD